MSSHIRAPRTRSIAFARFVAAVLPLAAVPALTHVAQASYIESVAAIPAPALRTGFPVSTGVAYTQPPAMADLDQDGRSEIVAVNDAGRISIITGTGVGLGGWPKLINAAPTGPPTIGDMDLDGFPEVICANQNNELWVFTFNGAMKYVPILLPSTPVGSAVLVEIGASGKRAAVIVTADGTIHAFDEHGDEAAGFPIVGGVPARGGAFTFIGYDNFARLGYLATDGTAKVYFTYAAPDTQYTFASGLPFGLGPAMPVSGARQVVGLNDLDNLYLAGRGGGLWRFDPNITSTGGAPVALTAVSPDSVLDTPGLADFTGDMIPELIVRSHKADTLSVRVIDGAAGNVLAGWPRKYLASSAAGGVAVADLGDGATPEIVLNEGGDKFICLTSSGATSWTLTGLASVSGPTIGDLDGDGGLDLAVATTDGKVYAYTLGVGGVGPKGVEWPSHDGNASRDRRHHIRDRATLRSQWPAPIAPASSFTARPVFADLTGEGLPEVVASDYLTSKTWAWTPATALIAGFPQSYGRGATPEAPSIGDVNGDGVFDVVQSTANGYVVWGDRTGAINSMLVDNGRVLTPPSLADINNDGVLDVVVGSSAGRLYALNLVSKTVISGFPVSLSGSVDLPAALGDVNGDGQTDIVVVSGQKNIYAYPRTGVTPLTGWPKSFPNFNSLTQPILVPVAGQTGLAVSFGQIRPDSVFAQLVGANGSPKAGWPKRLTGLSIFGPIAGDVDNDGAPDFVFTTDQDSMYVFVANGNRAMARRYVSSGNLEVAAMVDVDLDQRPDIILVSDQSAILGVRFNGLLARSFDRLTFFSEIGQTPTFGDLSGDGELDMAVADLGQPIDYHWGAGSWNSLYAPWPMKGHDRKRTNAFSGLTVVGVDPMPRGPSGVAFARALPNPASGRVTFTLSRPLVGRFDAAVYDLRGRLVRRLGAGEARAGDGPPSWTWDGRDEAGTNTAAGVYFYRVADAEGAVTTRVVRLQ